MARRKQARRPGEGSVYQRKDGRWVCEITLEDHSRKTYYFKTEKEALDRRRVLLNELAQGTIATGPQQTVKQFLEYWLEDVYKPSVRLSTVRNVKVLMYKHIIPALGHVKLQKLTAQQVQSFYAKKLKEGMAPSRIKSIHLSLHNALEHARRVKLVAFNVCKDVQLPKQQKSEKHFLTPEQARMLLQYVKGHQLEVLITVALTTGLREGELIGLRWSDIDFERGILNVARTVSYLPHHGFVEGDPKTKTSARTIYLPSFVVDMLKQHRITVKEKRLLGGASWVNRDLVFPARNGNYIIFNSLLRQFYKVLDAAGLPRIKFHDLRHSAATLLLSMGVEMKVIQEILGHSSIVITADLYSHVLPHMHTDAMHRMDSFFDSSSS